ncbi:MAG TPA: dTDP-4-dehydrorhamnose 3,5-epimerase [Polyangiaceae bacterium]|jgi:dTDP-4-dehydrorhamnose 3,5-epimerase|nr:dTDP-4-dehydrorhamnose 3,5-epimerase [Polyangiaceae bacterium]
MLFSKADIPGVWIVDLERREDERGFFARTWCADELSQLGLAGTLSQCSVSYNARSGTLRGMHYQIAPRAEEKVVSVSRGAILDVVVDLRPASKTFRKWTSVELTERNGRMLYVPAGVAHGFQTLADDTVVDYKISAPYAPDHARGVRWNDPAFGIEWPSEQPLISERDRSYPDYVS